MASIPVGILGATGMVGQQFIALLADHPWFKVEWLGASQRSEGKAFRDAAAWRLPNRLPDDVAPSRRRGRGAGQCAEAGVLRPRFLGRRRDRRRLRRRPATSSSATRATTGWMADVPLLIPEVNADHLKLLDAQAAARGWKGRIVTNPNCSTVVLAMALAPLRQFGLETTMITTLQAISGAGYPGVAVVGHPRQRHPAHRRRGREDRNRDEEDSRLARRTASVRAASGAHQRDDDARAGAERTHRVDLRRARRSSRRPKRSSTRGSRSAAGRRSSTCRRRRSSRSSTPPKPNRPQPILDVNRDGGMTVTVGRLRACPLFDYKFVALGHNTIRGAAGAAILNAELMHREGLL